MKYRNMRSLSGIILVGFCVMIFLFFVHGVFSFQAIRELSGLIKTLHDHPLIVSNAALLANTNIIKIHRGMKDVVLSNDTQIVDETILQINHLEIRTFKELREVRENILGSDGERIASDATELFKDWKPIRDNVIRLVRDGKTREAAMIARTRGADHVAKLESKMFELNINARNKALDFLNQTEKVRTNVNIRLAGILVTLIVFSTCIALVTVRKAQSAESRLSEEKETLLVTLRSIGDGVIATDPNGTVTLMNQVAEWLTGWSEKEAVGKKLGNVFNIINEQTREAWANPVEKVVSSNCVVGLASHTILIAKDGTERAVAHSGAPIIGGDGRIAGVVIVFRDQTDEREYQQKIVDSEERFRLLSDNTLDAIWTMDLDLKFTYINQACLAMTGYTPEEWIGSHLQDHCSADSFNQMVDLITYEIEKERKGGGIIFETVMLKKNGDSIPMEIHGKAIYNDNFQPVRIQGVSRDITERKRAEKILRMSEERFATIFRSNPAAISLVRVDDTRLVDINDAWEKMTGYTREEALGRTPLELGLWVHPEHREELMKRLIKKGATKIETRIRQKSGAVGYALISAEIIELNEERYMLTMSQDITEQKQAEKALRYQEQLLQDMGSLAKVGGWEFDPATDKGTWTEQVAHIHEVDPADETSMEIGLSYYQHESRVRIEKAIRDAIEFGKAYDLELELVTAQGNHKWVRTIGQPKVENGNVVHIRGSFQDITAQKRSEQRIHHLNRVLRAIRDVKHLIVHERNPEVFIREACRLVVDYRGYASALIILTDEDHRLVSWAESGLNAVFETLTAMFESGWLPPCCDNWVSADDVFLIKDRRATCSGCSAMELYPELDALCARLVHDDILFGYFIASIDPGLAEEAEERALFAEMAADLAYALSFSKLEKAREVSEQQRRSLENQLRQAQKMESVGRLAGGVAHDFNNILGVIMGSAELAIDQTDAGDSLHEYLKEIFNAANRSTKITRQLLAFARRQPISPQVINLNDTVESMLKMLRRLIGEDIDLAWLPVSGLWPVKMDPSQLDQILANLCVNARDAITDVGRVTIETDRVTFDEDYCVQHAGFIPGDFVMLAVSDDGCGIEKETLDIIFEPFFTTKELGQGTGLGLSTVYGIVKQNEGFINVYSEPDKGTTFKIYLPRCVGEVVDDDDKIAQKELHKGSGETVLVVEDDPSLLHLVESILVSLGYTALTAQTPTKAIQMAKTFKHDILLVITDVIMPEMNGRKLAQQLQARHPGLKCLFMSGYTANVIAHRGILEEGVYFLQKPFSMSELAEKIKEVLWEGEGDRS